jgi:competence protein ComFC
MQCDYCGKHKQGQLTLKELFLPSAISSHGLCQECAAQFQRLPTDKICYGCNRPSITTYCQDCQKWQKLYPQYDFHHEALYHYNEYMHEWMKLYKFQGAYHLRTSFAQTLRAYFHAKRKEQELIIPIPITDLRMSTRGFNQVEGLLLSAKVNYQPLLKRRVDNAPQAQKTRTERLQLKQPFEVPAKFKENIMNRAILLVDDVYTTGRTLFHAAEAIQQCYPKNVRTFSLAR